MGNVNIKEELAVQAAATEDDIQTEGKSLISTGYSEPLMADLGFPL